MADIEEWRAKTEDLCRAAAEGNLEDVKELLEAHKGICDVWLAKPLHEACKNGHVDIVKYLIHEGGALVDAAIYGGYSPIHKVCEDGNVEMLKVLLDCGASVNVRAQRRQPQFGPDVTPIWLACYSSQTQVVETLLDHGANPNDLENPDFNPLHVASTQRDIVVMKALLDRGANVNFQDCEGKTPLHHQAPLLYGGHVPPEMYPHEVRLFEELVLTAWDEKYSVSITLLESGADPNVLDHKSQCVLGTVRLTAGMVSEYANRMNRYLSLVIPKLLDYGAGVLPCRLEESQTHSKCSTSVLCCTYSFFRRLSHDYASDYYRSVVDAFEKHFIKLQTAGVLFKDVPKPVDPPETDVDWTASRRDSFRELCEVEIQKMVNEAIPGTSATYHSLLTRDLTALRDQEIVMKLSSDKCLAKFPIFGDMIFSSYVALQRFLLLDETISFFTMFSPPLLPDCVKMITRFLLAKDQRNLIHVARIFHAHQNKTVKDFGQQNCK